MKKNFSLPLFATAVPVVLTRFNTSDVVVRKRDARQAFVIEPQALRKKIKVIVVIPPQIAMGGQVFPIGRKDVQEELEFHVLIRTGTFDVIQRTLVAIHIEG